MSVIYLTLAAGCYAAKVSSRSPGKEGQVLCVYTRDYLNESEVFAVRDALRGACGWTAAKRMVGVLLVEPRWSRLNPRLVPAL